MAKQLTADIKSLQEVEGWYQDQAEALNRYKKYIIAQIVNTGNVSTINIKFDGMSIEDVDTHFGNNEQELEHLTCLYLIASTEGYIMSDLKKRCKGRDKSGVGRDFRSLIKSKKSAGDKKVRVSLEREILQIWKDRTSYTSFSDFIGLLKYRHWLAHGRNWMPKIGRVFTFDYAFKIAAQLVNDINNY